MSELSELTLAQAHQGTVDKGVVTGAEKVSELAFLRLSTAAFESAAETILDPTFRMDAGQRSSLLACDRAPDRRDVTENAKPASDLTTAAGCTILAAALLLAGCGPDVAKWQEEVRLSDGKVIVLERKSTIGPGSPIEHRGTDISHELCYKPMGVYLKTGGVYHPEIFDVRNGVAYVALPMKGCISCQLKDFPEFSTVFLRFSNGSWERIGYSEFPTQADTNLLQRIFDGRASSRDIGGYVSLDRKRKHDGDPFGRGGTFKKWMHGERGTVCEKCAQGPKGRIEVKSEIWELVLDNGKRC